MGFDDIVGQEEVVSRLRTFGDLYSSNGALPEHVLITGEDGMGKMSIANAFASENGLPAQELRNLEIRADLTAALTNLRERQALIVPRIGFMKQPILELLEGAARSGKLEIKIGHGMSARTHILDLKPFTLIATTPRKSDCSADTLSLFSLTVMLQQYSHLELQLISRKIAEALNIGIDEETASLIAANCHGRPEHIDLLLRRLVRSVRKGQITQEDTVKAFSAFGLGAHLGVTSIVDGIPAAMAGTDFERLIVVLLTRMGFRADMTKTTGDGGIDIVAFLDRPIVGGKYLFQCKRYSPDNIVGAPTVRDFYGAVTADRAVKGIFITTSCYTTQAREFADRVGIELIDQEKLLALMAENGMTEI
jgi:Holliday junction resolvasome RuvABC ATP-dependent DNA helicase subunit